MIPRLLSSTHVRCRRVAAALEFLLGLRRLISCSARRELSGSGGVRQRAIRLANLGAYFDGSVAYVNGRHGERGEQHAADQHAPAELFFVAVDSTCETSD